MFIEYLRNITHQMIIVQTFQSLQFRFVIAADQTIASPEGALSLSRSGCPAQMPACPLLSSAGYPSQSERVLHGPCNPLNRVVVVDVKVYIAVVELLAIKTIIKQNSQKIASNPSSPSDCNVIDFHSTDFLLLTFLVLTLRSPM